MELTADQKQWASKARQGVSKSELQHILIKQKGKCALSDVDMNFDLKEGTPIKGGKGCHPLYPAVDHIDPGNAEGGYQIVCYALNDLKGHLPIECFEALQKTKAWNALMNRWREQVNKDRTDRAAFKRLLDPMQNPKHSEAYQRHEEACFSPVRRRVAQAGQGLSARTV